MSDRLALQRISERVLRAGDPNDPDTPRALLTLAEFFDGNDVIGSIGCNLSESPSPQVIHAALKDIAARSDVHEVRVVITAFDEPDWPFSDTVVVVTTATPGKVQSWFAEELAPDDTWEGLVEGQSHEPLEVPPKFRVVSCWWD